MNNYNELARSLISKELIPKTPQERASTAVKELLQEEYVVDVHTHFFDMHCINSGFFVLRMVKDLLKIRGEEGNSAAEKKLIEDIYETAHIYEEGWNERLANELGYEVANRGGIKSIIFNLLWKTKMEDVYDYYLKDSSLATYFGYSKSQVLTTVLMMDFNKGWGVKAKKSMVDQILELKKLQRERPVLPFLFCDPRRADESSNSENLYTLFDLAFASKENSFFGVKIYPSLGYDPSDYRLWPIYEICEELEIPVLTHCGGASVSTKARELVIYEGDKRVELREKDRKDLGTRLNDPGRWRIALERFPKLKLNIAHFGSDGTWTDSDKISDIEKNQNRKETIIELMEKYENVYSDFSYTITHEQATKNFKKEMESNPLVAERSMFGSDYWVVSKSGELKENQEKFLNIIKKKEMIDALVKKNPMRYLFGVEV